MSAREIGPSGLGATARPREREGARRLRGFAAILGFGSPAASGTALRRDRRGARTAGWLWAAVVGSAVAAAALPRVVFLIDFRFTGEPLGRRIQDTVSPKDLRSRASIR